MTDAPAIKEDKARRIIKKSPRCPSFSLPEALERVLRVYEKESRHEAPADVVAQNMGYANSRTGPAASALASLTYFGLLTRPSEGKLAVPKEFEEYKFAPQESQKQELVRRWLRTPTVYAELLDKYPTGLPSDATLKYEFIQKGFNAKGVDVYLSCFRESVEFAKYYDSSNTPAQEEQTAPSPSNELVQSQHFVGHAAPSGKPQVNTSSFPTRLPDMEEHDSIPIRLPGGRKAILIIPSPFYEADKQRLKSQIDNIYADEEIESHDD